MGPMFDTPGLNSNEVRKFCSCSSVCACTCLFNFSLTFHWGILVALTSPPSHVTCCSEEACQGSRLEIGNIPLIYLDPREPLTRWIQLVQETTQVKISNQVWFHVWDVLSIHCIPITVFATSQTQMIPLVNVNLIINNTNGKKHKIRPRLWWTTINLKWTRARLAVNKGSHGCAGWQIVSYTCKQAWSTSWSLQQADTVSPRWMTRSIASCGGAALFLMQRFESQDQILSHSVYLSFISEAGRWSQLWRL